MEKMSNLKKAPSIIFEPEDEVKNPDMYEFSDYEPFHENSVLEDFEELHYLIQRGKVEDVIQFTRDQKIAPDTQIRPTGDTLMHVCAEYG